MKLINLVGKKFGRLEVISRGESGRAPCGRVYVRYVCRCECGHNTLTDAGNLRAGTVKSCGCLRRENLSILASRNTGNKSPSWKGGVSLDGQGYRVFGTGANKGRLEHRVIMEDIIGRKLSKKETIHHKNGKRDDNRPENLELRASQHGPGQRTEDLVSWAVQVLSLYAPEKLK
jgi:hypothetical protein